MSVNLLNIKELDNFLLSFLEHNDNDIKFKEKNLLKTTDVQQVENNKKQISHIMVTRFFIHHMRSFLLTNEKASYFNKVKYSPDLPEWAKKNISENKNVYQFCKKNVSPELMENIKSIRDFLYRKAEEHIDNRINRFYSSDKKNKSIKINIDCLKTYNEYSSFESLLDAVKYEKKLKKEQEFLSDSMRDTQIMMEFNNGIKIVNLKSNIALYFESHEMNHCIADGEYDRNNKRKNIQIYSLRDKKGHSHVTLEVRDGKLCQCKGHNNKKPNEEYLPYVRQFIISQNFDISGDIKLLGIFKQEGHYYDLYNLPKGFVYKGTLDLSGMKLTKLPDLSDIEVTGSFICRDNALTSLVGAPKKVGGSFFCNANKLTDLTGAPEYVGGNFYCTYSKLQTLQGSPKIVGGSFVCSGNNLETLKGAPQKVGENFDCSYNKLQNLEYLPKDIGGKIIYHHNLFIIQDNKVYDLNNLPDGFVIKGDLDLSGMGLTKLPNLSKVIVEGNFNCSDNNLTQLDGMPKEIGGNFDFSKNKISKLDRYLSKISGNITYSGNPFVKYKIEKKKKLYRKRIGLVRITEDNEPKRLYATKRIKDERISIQDKRAEFFRSLQQKPIRAIFSKAAKVENIKLQEAALAEDEKKKLHRQAEQKIRQIKISNSR